MSENSSLAENFVNDAIEIYQEFENLFTGSFDKKIVSGNIELIKQKRYAIVDAIWEIDDGENKKFLFSLLDAVHRNSPEYGDEIEKLKGGLVTSENSTEFVLNILQNKHRNITDFVRQHRLTNEFFTFYSIFAGYKYRNSVMQFIREAYDFKSHMSGLCPVCGHWPGIAYIIGEKGTRLMSCICCGAQWKYKRIKCSFCLTAEMDKLGYLNVEGADLMSAYTCEKCRRYIKTMKIDSEDTDVSGEKPIIDYLNSGLIDVAALQNKYVQESMLVTRFSGPEDKHLDTYINLLTNE